jgi:peroxiredoxin
MSQMKAWLAALVIAGSTAAAPADAGEPKVDPRAFREALAGYELTALDGSELSWDALRGEVVVVSFWASWCKPCRKEMPELDALHAEISKKRGRVVAISIDHDAENARRFAEVHKLELPLYHDGPTGLAKKLDLPHIPYTVVLDRGGEVALTTSGASDKELEKLAVITRRLANAQPQVSAVAEGDTE